MHWLSYMDYLILYSLSVKVLLQCFWVQIYNVCQYTIMTCQFLSQVDLILQNDFYFICCCLKYNFSEKQTNGPSCI